MSTLPRTAESPLLVSPLPTLSVLPSPSTRSPVKQGPNTCLLTKYNVGYGTREPVEQDLEPKTVQPRYQNHLLLKHVVSVTPSVRSVS